MEVKREDDKLEMNVIIVRKYIGVKGEKKKRRKEGRTGKSFMNNS